MTEEIRIYLRDLIRVAIVCADEDCKTETTIDLTQPPLEHFGSSLPKCPTCETAFDRPLLETLRKAYNDLATRGARVYFRIEKSG